MAGDGYFELSNNIREWLPKLKGAPFACFLVLASHRGKNNEAWPSISTLAKETGYEKRQVFRALKRLEELNCILRLRNSGKSNRYRLVASFIKPPAATGDKNVTSDLEVTPPGAKMSLPPGAKMSPEEVPIEEEPDKKEPLLRSGMPSKTNADPWLSLAKHFRKRFAADRNYPIKATRDHLENEYDGEYTFEEVYEQIEKRAKEGAQDVKPWQLFEEKRTAKSAEAHPSKLDAWEDLKRVLRFREDVRVTELMKTNPIAAKVLAAMDPERVWWQVCSTGATNPDAMRREFMKLYDDEVKHEAARGP